MGTRTSRCCKDASGYQRGTAGMRESADTFTRSNAQGREGMVSGCRDTTGRYENGPGGCKVSLVVGMHTNVAFGASRHTRLVK